MNSVPNCMSTAYIDVVRAFAEDKATWDALFDAFSDSGMQVCGQTHIPERNMNRIHLSGEAFAGEVKAIFTRHDDESVTCKLEEV